ncbi:MAG: hypothetical protein ACFFBC_00055 [Promethearchaeota archaeon]
MVKINLCDKTRKTLLTLKKCYPLTSTTIEDVIDELCHIVLRNLEIREDLLKLNKLLNNCCYTEKELTSHVLCIFSKLYLRQTTKVID